MLWGVINAKGVGNLVQIKGIMDGPKYVRILQRNLLDSARKIGVENDYVFQQDNDPKHTSRIVTIFFSENHIKKMEWPSQSPYLNVIEHILVYIKREYAKSPATNKKDALKKIFEIWKNIPKSYIENLVKSIYKRCEEVICSKWEAITC
jgi:hypothetical protein